MPTPLTSSIIATHERLYPRLAALLKQVERGRPAAPVPEEIVRLARELCREAQKLLGREGLHLGLPGGKAGKAGVDHQGLAVVLGQVVAGLEAFEAAHSGWSKQRKCTVWSIDGPPRPVLRLLPTGSAANPVIARDRESQRHRDDVYRLIMARFAAGYDAGYSDAQAGKSPRSDYCQMVWDRLTEKRGEDAGRRTFGGKVPYDAPPPHLFPTGAPVGREKSQKN